MQRIVLGLAAALSLVATGLAPASAQNIPSGSYQQSCTNIRVRGDQLMARCNNTSGGTVRTSISLGSCRGGDIANSNGQLTCNANGYGRHRGGYGNGGYNNGGYNNGNGSGYGNGRYGNAPGGSYQQSCTSSRMRGSMLTATCPTANGQQITTTLDTSRCRNDIANINGRLECR
jgi:hypothetical protein